MKFSIFASALASAALVANGMSEKGQSMMQRKMSEWENLKKQGLMPRKVRSVRNQPQVCSGGSVTIDGESFGCNAIDFQSFLSLNDATITGNGVTSAGADIWGWLSPEGKEITLWCVDNGVWFVDTTDPSDPLQLGYMRAARSKAAWCDVKVYKDTAYVVKDNSFSFDTTTGIQVFDLNRLVGLTADASRSFDADMIYGQHGRSHNLAVDTESGFLYSVGTNTCSGGLHIINLENPLEPTFEVCVSGDGYTHDVQCVVYDGPTEEYQGHQICFAFNEDTLTIWDVTNKQSVQQIARVGYPTAEYTHQGWLTDDMKYVILNDELDEDRGEVSHTTTYFVNVEDLNNPVFDATFTHPEVSIDHNLYVFGAMHRKGWGGNPPMENPPSTKYAYLANYIAGIKVLDISDMSNVQEVGKFDVAPDITGNVFEGAWSSYMHPSGTLAVSSIDRGLFILTPQMAFDGPIPTSAPVTQGPTSPPVVVPTSAPVVPTSPPVAAPTNPAPTPFCIFFC